MYGIGNDCLQPILLTGKFLGFKDKRSLRVPCGHCLACKKRRTSEWSLRIVMESKCWDDVVHVTLTYDSVHLPEVYVESTIYNDTVDSYSVPFSTVVKRDVQLFLKRLRERTQKRIKYYCCGEYGERRQRAHYHCIIFGLDTFRDFQVIKDSWQNGAVFCKPFFGSSSAQYVSRYVQKKLYGDDSDNIFWRESEFALMSKGLGWSWFYEQWKNGRITAENLFISFQGYDYGVPRSFIRKLVTLGELESTSVEMLIEKQQFDFWKFISKLPRGVTVQDFEKSRRDSFIEKIEKKALQRKDVADIV